MKQDIFDEPLSDNIEDAILEEYHRILSMVKEKAAFKKLKKKDKAAMLRLLPIVYSSALSMSILAETFVERRKKK